METASEITIALGCSKYNLLYNNVAILKTYSRLSRFLKCGSFFGKISGAEFPQINYLNKALATILNVTPKIHEEIM